MTYDCGCSESEGVPCEAHMEVLAIREGASLHTAEELLLITLDDAEGAGYEFSEVENAQRELAWSAINDDDDWAEYLGEVTDDEAEEAKWFAVEVIEDLVRKVESEADFSIEHNDGYVMYRLTEDCPLAA